MALRLDSFGLTELAAKPEDAFRLAGLAMAEGSRLPGYGGDYYRLRMGDAQVVARTGRDRESGQEELLGMDAHAGSSCLWTVRVERDLTPPGADALSRRILAGREEGPEQAVVELLCPDVLPSIREGDTLRLNMAGFPLRISYDAGESSGAMEAGEDTTLLQGLVKDAKVGETYLGMEPLTKFVSVTASTAMGDVELCHPLDMVAERQRDMVRPGAVVSALCVLSGDCAIGEYAGGLVFGQEQNFRLLADFLRRGGTERLRPILRSDCAVRFLENRQEGVENALSLLELAGRDLAAAGLGCLRPGVLTAAGQRGRLCLLVGEDEERFALLCRMDTDSLGRVRELEIGRDPDWEFDILETFKI
mgnify:FL=1